VKAAVVIFPGSNCDRDMHTALATHGVAVQKVWHGESSLPSVDVVVLPGGFSFGDYLRCGAMAARSPIMREVIAHAGRGGYVLGVCNGFQILCESGLLPGTLMRNRGQRFLCQPQFLRVETSAPIFLKSYAEGSVVNFPIAHAEGNYFADADTLKALEDHRQIALRYCDAQGKLSDAANPNGSAHHIAGILNAGKNVLGMMPHPERHADTATGGIDGSALFTALAA
jgi:phosphoribosylformylglycinamidine synthase I